MHDLWVHQFVTKKVLICIINYIVVLFLFHCMPIDSALLPRTLCYTPTDVCWEQGLCWSCAIWNSRFVCVTVFVGFRLAQWVASRVGADVGLVTVVVSSVGSYVDTIHSKNNRYCNFTVPVLLVLLYLKILTPRTLLLYSLTSRRVGMTCLATVVSQCLPDQLDCVCVFYE